MIRRAELALPTLALVLLLSLPAAAESEPLWKLYVTEGQRAFNEGRFADAEGLFSQALVEAHRFAKPGDRRAWSHAFLAQTYAVLQRYDEADVAYSEAVKGISEVYGPTNPYVARLQVFWGQSFLDRRDYRTALAHLEPAIALYEASTRSADPQLRLREDDAHLAIARGTAGFCYFQLGEPQRAEPFFAVAMPVLERAGSGDPEVQTLRRSYDAVRSQLGMSAGAPPPPPAAAPRTITISLGDY